MKQLLINPDKKFIHLIVMCLFFICLTIFIKMSSMQMYFVKLQAFMMSIQGGYNAPGPLMSLTLCILGGAVLIGIGVPRLWISGLIGSLYGAYTGTLVALVTCLIGASCVYLAGLLFSRNNIQSKAESRLRSKFEHQFDIWTERFRQKTFTWVLYARLFPFSNSTLVSLFSGYCRISFFKFISASLLGFLPLTIVLCLFGSGSTRGNYLQIAIGIGLIFMIHTMTLLFKNMQKKRHVSFLG